MEITTYTTFRQKLSNYMNLVSESNLPLYVTRQGKEDMVMLSKSDYEGMQETLFLMSNPKNAKRLIDSIEEFERGEGQVRELID